MNDLSTIAEAVKVALKGASLGQAFSIDRFLAVPEYDTAATNDLSVLVIGATQDLDIHGPNATHLEYDRVHGVKIGIRKRIKAADATSTDALAELDGLLDFVQAMLEFLSATENRTMGNARLDSLKNEPAYDPVMLDKGKTFVSVIAANYRLLK